jgi:hypothetical protein
MKNNRQMNILITQDMFDYLKGRGDAEDRTPGNMARWLLKEKIAEEITKEPDMKYDCKAGRLIMR